MLDSKKDRFLAEARRIGDQLIDISQKSDRGLYWHTYGIEKNNSVSKNLMDNIVLGTAGPALFFTELFRQTQEKKYRDAAIDASRWLVHRCNEEPSAFYSFNTGRMGVAVALQKVSRIGNDSVFLKEALHIAESCDDFFKDYRLVSTWNNGAAGTIVALLHLHNETGEPWLLEKAGLFASYLINESFMGKAGLYWDRSHQNINGLCGFANGASGVAFAFLELGRYIGNEAFFWLAHQAFLYESQYFNPANKNWRDLRKVFRKYEDFKEHILHFQNNDIEFFFDGTYGTSWSYGAAGVGMARLRAVELSYDETLAVQARQAIDTAQKTPAEGRGISSLYSLSEGGGGVMDLLIKAAAVLDEPDYLNRAVQIADRALEQRQKQGYYNSALMYKEPEGDNSLFLSSPGIGYMFLRLIDPRHVPSVLLPEVGGYGSAIRKPEQSMLPPSLSLTLPDIKRRILGRHYPRTLEAAESVIPSLRRYFFETEGRDFTEYAHNEISGLPPEQSGLMQDIFKLEQKKREMDLAHSSHVMLHVKQLIRAKNAETWNQIDVHDIENVTFVLQGDLAMYECAHSDDVYLLIPTAYGIVENPLSPFTLAILQSFLSPTPAKQVITQTMELFEELTGDEAQSLKEKILEQIRLTIEAGFIVEA